jgi:hypothetical protein
MNGGTERIQARIDILREMKEEKYYRDIDDFKHKMNIFLNRYQLFRDFDDYLVKNLGLNLHVEDLIGTECIYMFSVKNFYNEEAYGDLVSFEDMMEHMCEEIPNLEVVQKLYDCVSEFSEFDIRDKTDFDDQGIITIRITFIEPL